MLYYHNGCIMSCIMCVCVCVCVCVSDHHPQAGLCSPCEVLSALPVCSLPKHILRILVHSYLDDRQLLCSAGVQQGTDRACDVAGLWSVQSGTCCDSDFGTQCPSIYVAEGCAVQPEPGPEQVLGLASTHRLRAVCTSITYIIS